MIYFIFLIMSLCFSPILISLSTVFSGTIRVVPLKLVIFSAEAQGKTKIVQRFRNSDGFPHRQLKVSFFSTHDQAHDRNFSGQTASFSIGSITAVVDVAVVVAGGRTRFPSYLSLFKVIETPLLIDAICKSPLILA